jgi:hypothetical protein
MKASALKFLSLLAFIASPFALSQGTRSEPEPLLEVNGVRVSGSLASRPSGRVSRDANGRFAVYRFDEAQKAWKLDAKSHSSEDLLKFETCYVQQMSVLNTVLAMPEFAGHRSKIKYIDIKFDAASRSHTLLKPSKETAALKDKHRTLLKQGKIKEATFFYETFLRPLEREAHADILSKDVSLMADPSDSSRLKLSLKPTSSPTNCFPVDATSIAQNMRQRFSTIDPGLEAQTQAVEDGFRDLFRAPPTSVGKPKEASGHAVEKK